MYTQMGAYMETHHHGNASKKGTHKTNLMSYSLTLKLKRQNSNHFHINGRSAGGGGRVFLILVS